MTTSLPNRKGDKIYVHFEMENWRFDGWIHLNRLRQALEFFSWDHAQGYLVASIEIAHNVLTRPTPALSLVLDAPHAKETLAGFLNQPDKLPLTAENILEWAEKEVRAHPQTSIEEMSLDGKLERHVCSNTRKYEVISLLLQLDDTLLDQMRNTDQEMYILTLRRKGLKGYESYSCKELIDLLLERIKELGKSALNGQPYPQVTLHLLLQKLGVELAD